MSAQNTLLCVPFGFKLFPHASINMTPQRVKMFALPVHLLRQVTGSAGTAMDVLVTCFSKMGGGFGRRGCKNRATVGVRRVSQIPFESRREKSDFRVFFSEMSLKHSACHTFRASRVPCITLKSHLKS